VTGPSPQPTLILVPTDELHEAAKERELLPRLLGAEEVALILGIPRKAVWVLAERGEIPYYRIGRRIRFSKEQISAYLVQSVVDG